MYKVFADGEILCSSEAEELALLDPIVNLEANCAGSFTFKMPPDHPFYNSLVFRQTLIDIYLDDELIFEGVPVSDSTDFYNVKTVECEGELSFLNDTVLTQAKYTNQTVSSLLAAYLQEHNDKADDFKQFQLGSVTVEGGNNMLRYTNYQTTMQEISEDLIDNYGGYLRVRHANGVRYLDYLAASPRTSSQVIQVGKNLMDLVQDTSTLDICTVLIPLGTKIDSSSIEGLDERLTVKSVNNNKEYIIGTGSAYFGYVWRTVTWDDVTVASNLLSKAQAYLADAQWANLVINATAYDLGLAVEDVQKFRVLDTIRVVSEPHGLDRSFMLTALQIDLNHPGDTRITLGSEQTLSLSAQSAALANELNVQTTNIIMSAAENARQILESATGGNIHFVYDQDGVCTEILIMDTNDISTATKIWRWNINGWGYSGDGGQTYSLAATMNGHIVADFIDTGTLTANVIKAGMLRSSTNSENWWNLSTGQIHVGFGGTIGGWDIDTAMIKRDIAITENNVDVTYSPRLYAPDSPTPTTSAIYIKRTENGVDTFPFRVRYNGELTATDAHITGEIIATSGSFTGTITAGEGYIAGWKIDGSLIYKDYTDGNGVIHRAQMRSGSAYASTNTAFSVRSSADDGVTWESQFNVTYGGKMTAIDGVFSGTITGSTITSTAEKTFSYSSYSSTDVNTVSQIILSGGYPTATQLNKYDFNQDGIIDVYDVAILNNMINDSKDYKIKTTTTISPTDSNSPIKVQFGGAADGSTISMSNGTIIGARYIRSGSFLALNSSGTVMGAFTSDGLMIYDSSRRLRARLDSSGLYFYNTSGTVTHSYPA